MKKFLNTLYITTQGSYLAKEGECVLIRQEQKNIAKIPLHTLTSIACFGQISCSPYLMQYCSELGISISWFTEYGRFQATVHGPTKGNVLLRREQYRKADDLAFSTQLSSSFIAGKLANSRTILRRACREYPNQQIEQVCTRLGGHIQSLEKAKNLDEIRGIEGDSAHHYFSIFPLLIRSKEDAFQFTTRNRRPPKDCVNTLLSFFYTMMMHDAKSALESVGLDPYVGYLHRDRPGRASLALDLIEEFRSYLADRLTLTLINRGQIKAKDFVVTESGAVHLQDNARKEILSVWQERKREEIEHPFLKEKMPVGLLFFVQAQLLARHIRNELNLYPPFFVR